MTEGNRNFYPDWVFTEDDPRAQTPPPGYELAPAGEGTQGEALYCLHPRFVTEPDTMQDGWDAALARIRALNLTTPAIQVPAIIAAADDLADAIELWRGEQRKSVQDALNAYYAARRHPGETAQGEVGQR